MTVVVAADDHSTGDLPTDEPSQPPSEKEMSAAELEARNLEVHIPRQLHAFSVTKSSVTLIWLKPDNVMPEEQGKSCLPFSYRVSYKLGDASSKTPLTVAASTQKDPTYELIGLLPSTQYTFEVVAVNLAGKASKPAVFTTETL